ncbi:hypothetical protein [Planococcus lenghuensis]|uniref:Uncharacterized protein n=1 Tax=Planococcus lenghuensis TaxID=2213202 RepID=A0A1Q2KYE3_9BACL|nr:hypothetical protein [Planococcus lenghuensis]AQQ53230.1 hypothetical protein B0X71_09165 [Planococcus lenghuensis]
MKLKKAPLIFSFALSALLVTGTTGFASGGSGMMNANDNGMMNMMGSEGMSGMMESEGMSGMMQMMNSPEGQEMMNACGDFMASVADEKEVE